jgi:hypothetical protein
VTPNDVNFLKRDSNKKKKITGKTLARRQAFNAKITASPAV